MREKLKKIVPVPIWRGLQVATTALHLRRTRVLLTANDTAILEKWVRDRRSLVEIGVFEGGSTLVLRQLMHPEGVLTGIDPFVEIEPAEAGQRGNLTISKMIVNRCKRGQVRFISDFSHNAAKTWTEPLDFVFIDGDHSEEGCQQDFEDWEKFVKPGGVILFHDARLGRPSEQPWMGCEGSTEVVNKLFRRQQHPRWKIVDEGGSIVVIQRV